LEAFLNDSHSDVENINAIKNTLYAFDQIVAIIEVCQAVDLTQLSKLLPVMPLLIVTQWYVKKLPVRCGPDIST